MSRNLRIAGIEMDADDIDREMATNPEVLSEITALANAAEAYWKSIAPVGDPATDPDSGSYKDSIKTKIMRGRNGLPFARIEASDYKAHWIEYGTGDPYPTPEFACMRMTKAMFAL